MICKPHDTLGYVISENLIYHVRYESALHYHYSLFKVFIKYLKLYFRFKGIINRKPVFDFINMMFYYLHFRSFFQIC